ncbi:hypothetical protein [Micromonospora thermarum]|uniref:Secreted protein n=1 Tax=Micromonospora thermarum TaxID=2720024 RepID=A0ABX0ZAR4_9ACTN|nr:hypothetical protein [Micromonospora thermarum]NJP33559.1 hypothetical protein [Micromonospora thermarum]
MTDIRRLVTTASLTAGLALAGTPAAAYAGPAVGTAYAAEAGASGPATCATAPSTPAKTPLGGFVRSTAHNTCSSYAVFWLLRYEPGGWRTVLERWMEPHTTARLDFDCRGTGPYTYRSVMWDPNMMGYLTSPDVVIAC